MYYSRMVSLFVILDASIALIAVVVLLSLVIIGLVIAILVVLKRSTATKRGTSRTFLVLHCLRGLRADYFDR